MKTNIITLSAALALSLLTSCDDKWSGDEPAASGGSGTVNLASMMVEINSNATTVNRSSETRASYDLSGFNVRILTKEGAQKASWTYSEMPGVFDLPAGDYSVSVVSELNPPAAAWEAPFFKGTKEFSIAAGDIKDLGTVTCNLANLMVSVRFTPELVASLDDGTANVSVKVNDSDALDFGVGETRSGYYALNEESSSMVAEFRGVIDGNTETLRQVFTDYIQPGYHRIITFGIHRPTPPDPDPEGTLTPDVEIDATVVTVDVNTGVTVDEDIVDPGERPGGGSGEDPGPTPPSPQSPISIDEEGSTLSLTAVNNAADFGPDVKDAKLAIKADNRFENLLVEINSPTLTPEELENVGLAKVFDLAHPAAYPLDDPQDFSEALSGLGFTIGDDLVGKISTIFDITQFMPLLQILGPGDHEFRLTVTDQATPANSKTFILKIKTN